jgi:hypothetical protein
LVTFTKFMQLPTPITTLYLTSHHPHPASTILDALKMSSDTAVSEAAPSAAPEAAPSGLPDYLLDADAVLKDTANWRNGRAPDYKRMRTDYEAGKQVNHVPGTFPFFVNNLVKKYVFLMLCHYHHV